MRVIILGNAGSGKSTMARRIIGTMNIPILSLDEIAWNEGPERKPFTESLRELQRFINHHDQWIIEGCYGDLIEAALPYCTALRFLNPGVQVCVEHCQNRPWEPDKFPSPEAQQAMFAGLITWVKEYEIRDDEYGLQRHRQIFDNFTGAKKEYGAVDAYNQD
ncbi:shikimate kinase [[Phormidium] sp. ETS-05]|uniref:shikimate kinase n=1 Tax=[Phormidium] sp. ETS-05 TaxID=222819 RepID=UPI001E63993A|nr:shikimate kinase [[Phormidium] sp. ETS-05]